MEVRFGDYIEEFRNELENVVEIIHNNSRSNDELDENIDNYFEQLKSDNYSLYCQTLGLLLSDHYKMLYDEEKNSELDENNREILELYNEIDNNEEIVYLIESEPYFLRTLLYQMSEYNALDYFIKRETLISCHDILEKLCKFSIFNIYDYLYYCQKYNPSTLKTIFNSDIKNGQKKEDAIFSILCTLDELYITDRKNYFELISDLLVEYYRIAKYELKFKKNPTRLNKLTKTISFLEHSDIPEIIKMVNNDKKINEILKRFTNFKSDSLIYDTLDQNYEKTITKLKSIKEY